MVSQSSKIPRIFKPPIGVETIKAHWDSGSTKLFLQVVVCQVKKGNRPTQYLNNKGWYELMKTFYNITGKYLGLKQMKNKYEALKKDFVAWSHLKNSDHGCTGLGWDPIKKTFIAPNYWWDKMISMHKHCSKFRAKGLEHEDLMEQVFSGITTSGKAQWTLEKMRQGASTGQLNFPDGLEGSDTPVEGTFTQHIDGIPSSMDVLGVGIESESVSATSTFKGNKRTSSAREEKKRERKKKNSKIDSLIAVMDRIVEAVSVTSSEVVVKKSTYAAKAEILECLKMLANLPGVSPGDPLYLFGATLVTNDNYRIIFQGLPNDAIRVAWLMQEELMLHPKALAIQDSSPAHVHIGQNNSSMVGRDEMQNGGPCVSPLVFDKSKKIQDDLQLLCQRMKQHEDNMKFLKSGKNSLDDSILDMQVALGKFHSSSVPMTKADDISHVESEEETIEHILRHEKSAAGTLCQLKTHHENQASHIQVTKNVLGIVATLGKVDDDNLSRLLSEYLGMETMLAVVCKTYDGVKALETYEKDGSIATVSGLHALGASIGKPLDGRFLVICLEHLRPYVGEFIADDPQRTLDLLKPKLSNGETPPGFLGFAVNMINVDSMNLYCLTTAGDGLRETLFYNLFSHLQVYKTRADMLEALPCIIDGALSLDGGIIRSTGVLFMGNREDVDVKFPKSSGRFNLPENYFETENRIKEMKWKKERVLEDMQREQGLLDLAKFNYEIKKQEFVKFLAQSSSHATQQNIQAGRSGGAPI